MENHRQVFILATGCIGRYSARMKSDSITMADIAEKVGVHKSTVTRALRNDPRIRSETAQKILRAAKELGYEPNPAASAFSEMRWRRGNRVRRVNFAFLSVDKSDSRVTKNPQYQRVLKRARNMGYELLPLALNLEVTPVKLTRRLKVLNIQGVVLDEIGYHPKLLPSFDWDSLNWSISAWVSLGEGEYAHPGYRVLHNSFLATMDALRAMVERGYHRIYFARDPNMLRWESWREQAATLLVCKEHPTLRVYDKSSRNLPKSIDAVLGSDPDIARKFSMQLGIKPRASLAVRDPEDPDEAGMYLNPDVEAGSAVELLDRNYRRGAPGLPEQRQTIMLESAWRDGNHLPPRIRL